MEEPSPSSSEALQGQLEEWYVQNQNIWSYFMLIVLTIGVVLFSRLDIVWKVFSNLPKPTAELEKALLK